MDPDTVLVLGFITAALAVPSMLSAAIDQRIPRASAVTILIAGGLIVYAFQTQPGGYTLDEIPHVFVRVIAQIVH